MVELTFLEVHFEDADLTANAPYSSGDADGVPDQNPRSRKGTVLALLVGLAFSIAVAYLVRKKVFGGENRNGNGDGDGSGSAPEA
jgi:hypothetical protein